MDQVIKKIKKHDKICFVIISIFCMVGILLNNNIKTGDEIWVFQNINKMFNGFIIYKDANVITTPLYYFIGNILFKIIGANLLTQRIFSILINVIMAFITYLILNRLKMEKIIAFLSALLLGVFLNVNCGITYNEMALMFVLFGLYNILKTDNRKITDEIIQGIIIALIFLTKQNIGVYYVIGLFVYRILIKKFRNIKGFMVNGLISLFIIVIYLLVLKYNGILYNFIDYTFLGLSSFATNNVGFNIINIIVAFFFLGINIALTIFFAKEKKIRDILESKDIDKIQTLTIFSIPMLFYAYPIFNEAHTIMAIYLSLIEIIYIIFGLIFKDFFENKKFLNIFSSIIIMVIIIISNINLIFWFVEVNNENYPYSIKDKFYGAIIDKGEYKKDQNVLDFIKNNNKKVIVFGIDAARYMPILDRSNGNFDLPLIGNLGSRGEDGLIEDIIAEKNTIFLLKIQEENFWQESEKAIKYIKNNLEKQGTIEDFEIYYNK